MPTETIVAVFDTDAHAENAIADLKAAGIPSSAVQHYAKDDYPTSTDNIGGVSESRPQGFWAWLTGEDEDTEYHSVYDRSIESGGTVVTVIVDDQDSARIVSLLEAHSPIDLEERGALHGNISGQTFAESATAGASMAASTSPSIGGTPTPGMMTGRTSDSAAVGLTGGTSSIGGAAAEQVIPLAEETLNVGKRQVDRGTTRLRRYVVERPVEEQIRLRNETVSVHRRAVTAGDRVSPDAFTDKTIEVRETAEEAVVGKTARVVEEVVVQKGVDERVETVRDTVRREQVEISGAGSLSGAGSVPAAGSRV